MRAFLLALMVICHAPLSQGAEVEFEKTVKASLVFREESNPTKWGYPRVLLAFLRLDNVRDGEVTWVANSVRGIEAELLDENGKPASQPPTGASIQSNDRPFVLPYGSRLDWLISHGGVSMVGADEDHYALVVGGRGWLVPVANAGSYTLRIRLRGRPWTQIVSPILSKETEPLLNIPASKLELTPPDGAGGR
jgi:hypothetical protein